MNLSPQQIRLCIGIGNVVLLLLITWLAYGTFWTVEPAEYEADWIELKEITIGMPGQGTTRLNPRRYDPIVALFGKPKAPRPPRTDTNVIKPPPVKKIGPLDGLMVKGFMIDQRDNPENDACILSNRGKTDAFFYIGDELSAKDGFEKYVGWAIKDIVPLNEFEGQVNLISSTGSESTLVLERKEG